MKKSVISSIYVNYDYFSSDDVYVVKIFTNLGIRSNFDDFTIQIGWGVHQVLNAKLCLLEIALLQSRIV